MRVVFIVNPRAGVVDNLGMARSALAALTAKGWVGSIEMTEARGCAERIAREVSIDGEDIICGVGGDGTTSEIVNGLMARDVEDRPRLAQLPGGTGNAFLRDLELRRWQVAVERILKNTTRRLDLFEISVGAERLFGFNIVGWGVFSTAGLLAERFRRMGRSRYDLAGFLEIVRNRKFEGSMSADEEDEVAGPFRLVVASNTAHTGNGLKLAPDAILDDGKLELLYLHSGSIIRTLGLFLALRKGTHIGRPGVHYRRVERLRLATDGAWPINVDGEIFGSGGFEVQVRPRALRLAL